MFKKIFDYFSTRGIYLMVLGFVVLLGGMLVYISIRQFGNWWPQAAMGFAITGFVIYVIGRILVATQRRKNRNLGEQ